jgi:hypothetical protein
MRQTELKLNSPQRWILAAAAFATAFGIVLAQQNTPSTAIGWLDTARAAHGGVALENLNGYRETGTFRVAATMTQPQSDGTYTILADLAGNRFRREFTLAGVRVIQNYENNTGYFWSSSLKRKEAAPASGLANYKASLYQGWLGLRFATRDTSSLLGTQTFGTVSGTSVNATKVGVQEQFLFSDTGELVAEKLDFVGFGNIVMEYRNMQLSGGLKIPFETRLLKGTTLVATQITQTATLNPYWTATDFASP